MHKGNTFRRENGFLISQQNSTMTSFTKKINIPNEVAEQIAKFNDQTQEIERLKVEIERLKAENTKIKAGSSPVLFAEPGDLFWHPTAEEYSRYDRNVFRFEIYKEGKFVFQWVEGGNGIDCSRYGALNGGVRDLIGAFPVSNYVDPDDPENADRISLPAHMIWGFRTYVDPDEEDEEEQEYEYLENEK